MLKKQILEKTAFRKSRAKTICKTYYTIDESDDSYDGS